MKTKWNTPNDDYRAKTLSLPERLADALWRCLDKKASPEQLERWTKEVQDYDWTGYDKEELVAAMRWAFTDEFWVTRIFHMGNFIKNVDSILGRYRGEGRKQEILEAKETSGVLSPEGAAIMADWPGQLRTTVIDLEAKRRYQELYRQRGKTCHRCHREPYVPIRHNFPDGFPQNSAFTRPWIEHDADGDVLTTDEHGNPVKLMVPCGLCSQTMGTRFNEIYAEVEKALKLVRV